LLTMVAELIVTTGPMTQVGWASACSGVTSASSARVLPAERPAAGGDQQAADLAAAAGAQALGERRVLGVDRHDLSPGVDRWRTRGPPAMSDSLLASASTRPASSAARVGARPIEPVMPLRTTSQGSAASSVAASGPPGSAAAGTRRS
jgi:hypothetical protein